MQVKWVRAGLHDNVPADLSLLPWWQKVRQFRATQPRCTDVPSHNYFGDNFCQQKYTFWSIVTVLILSVMVAGWHPTGATLVEGRSGTLSCNPALIPGVYATVEGLLLLLLLY